MVNQQLNYINKNGIKSTGWGIKATPDNYEQVVDFARAHGPCGPVEDKMPELYIFRIGSGYNVRRYSNGKLDLNQVVLHDEWLVCDIYGLEVVPPFSIIADETKIDREDRLEDRLTNFSEKIKEFKTSAVDFKNYTKDGSNYWFGFQGDNNFNKGDDLKEYFSKIWGNEDFSDWELASLWDLKKDSQWDGKAEFDKLFDNELFDMDYDGDCACSRDIVSPYDHLDVFELIQDASELDVDFFEEFITPAFEGTGMMPRFRETYIRAGGIRYLQNITMSTPDGNFLVIEPGDTVIRFKDELFVHKNEYKAD